MILSAAEGGPWPRDELLPRLLPGGAGGASTARTRRPSLLLLALLASAGALADPRLSVLPSSSTPALPPIEVATEDLPPLAYLDPAGGLRGESAEWVGRAMRRLGLEGPILVYPWARGLESLKTTPGFFLFNLARTLDRERDFLWVYRTASKRVGAFALRSRSDIVVKDLESLRPYHLVVLNQNIAHLSLLARGFGGAEGSLSALPSERNIIPFLYQGRADVWVRTYRDPRDLDGAIRAAGFDPSELLLLRDLEGMEVELYLAANKATPGAQVEAFRAAMAETAPLGKR